MRYGVARSGLWACALLIAFGPSCVSVVRQERTALRGAAAYSHAEDEAFSCDDAPPVQRHHQVGGSAELTHYTPEAHYYGGRTSVLVGSLEDSNFVPDESRSPYALIGFGATTGWDLEYFGHELGLNVVFAPQAVGRASAWITGMPYYRLRMGAYDGLAAELQAGSRSGLLFDTRVLAAGIRGGSDMMELHMGAALGARLMVDQERHSTAILFGTRESLDWTFYADGEVALNPCWRVLFALQLGQQLPLVMLGIGHEL